MRVQYYVTILFVNIELYIMKIAAADKNGTLNRSSSKDSTTTVQPNLFNLDSRFYLLYYSLLIFIFCNAIGFYKVHKDAAPVLIIGLITSVAVLVSSLLLILMLQRNDFPAVTATAMYAVLYFMTGLVIIISDPQAVLLFTSLEKNLPNSNLFLLALLSIVGAKYLIKSRKIYLCLSYILTGTAFGLSFPNTISHLQITLHFLLLSVLVFYLSGDLIEIKPVYQILATEEISDFIIEHPNTPLEEILVVIHKGIENIVVTSKSTPPEIQRICKRIVRLFKRIMNKIQNTDNIYLPRLDLVTVNMNEDDRLYIEQEFFDGHTSKVYEEKPVIEIEVAEYGMSELNGFLSQIGKEWNFNTFFVAGCSKYPAMIIGKFALLKYGAIENCSVSENMIEAFLTDLEKKYPDNFYHNSTHAADVMCSFMYFLTNSPFLSSITGLERYATIIASLAHDVGHPGKNNRFLVATSHQIALTYNDISVLEMMHASILFQILSNPDLNIFKNFTLEAYTQLRKLIIDMILATDMAKHFDIVSSIRTKYNENSDFTNREVRADLFKICMKSADVGHAGKAIELHERWCSLIVEEFYQQGDLEKQQGLPISMYCDRNNTNISKSQAGFIKNIVLTLFVTLNTVFASEEIEKNCVDQLRANEAHWVSLEKQRNLSSIYKAPKRTEESHIFPLLNKKSLRKGSLPPVYASKLTANR